jgi:hypothetical protein
MSLADTRYAKAALYCIFAAIAVVVLARSDAVAIGLDGLLLGLGLILLALLLLLADAVAAPTTGKTMWAVGLVLLVVPVFVDAVPYWVLFVGLALLFAARFQRIREVVPF